MRRPLLAGLVVAALLFSTGCAFGTRTVHLGVVTCAGVAGATPTGLPIVVVARPVDSRPEPGVVGCVRNGFHMRTAGVVAENDVCAWVQDCLAASLSQYGYDVRKGSAGETVPAGSYVVLQPTVQQVFCDSYMNYRAKVELSAELVVGEHRVPLGSYGGEASSMNWAARAATFSELLEQAMRQCLANMVPSLNQRLSSYGRTS